ncbi:glycoside hydrolase family 78 protein [Streptosporangium sp. NPDC002607]
MTANVTGIRFEHLREPLGVGVARPRLSWIARTSRGGWPRSAYEIEARRLPEGRPGTAERHTTVRQALALLPGNEPALSEIEAAFAGPHR